jgi:uncharacterized protein
MTLADAGLAGAVCSMPGRGVSARSTVNHGPFATTAAERLSILERYRHIAMVGLSADPYRPSHFAALYLRANGYDVVGVNPRETEILGRPAYPSLREVPGPIEVVDIFRNAAAVPAIVNEAIEIGARVIWMQLGVVHEAAAQVARDAGLEVVMDRCMKIEHARYFGGLATLGLNTGVISARRMRAPAVSATGRS